MTAKKILRITTIILFIAIALPASSSMISPGSSESNSAPKTENPRVEQLLQRLASIRAINRSELTRLEKKDLRKELKGIKKEMKAAKGVYLSVGAIIIIILLLILIL